MNELTETAVVAAQGTEQVANQVATVVEATSQAGQAKAIALGVIGTLTVVGLTYGAVKLAKKAWNGYKEKKNQPPVQPDSTPANGEDKKALS
jgi:hypothetical protein